jgi:hypothetical protein
MSSWLNPGELVFALTSSIREPIVSGLVKSNGVPLTEAR